MVSSQDLTYKIPAGQATAQLEAKASLFIATVGPAESVEVARAFIQQVASQYADADHNAWAFKITEGPQAEIGSSDDGEPGGTAGRPMLAVLSGSDVRQVVVVGTRYFGGVKLGTGGLVRAYGGVAREALKVLPTLVCRLYQLATITADYTLYGSIKYLLPQHDVRVMDERFSDAVELDIAVPFDGVASVGSILRELSNGGIMLAHSLTDVVYMEDTSA